MHRVEVLVNKIDLYNCACCFRDVSLVTIGLLLLGNACKSLKVIICEMNLWLGDVVENIL